MALKKKIIGRSGIPLEYWKIGSFYVDPSHNLMDITLIPYINIDTRSNGMQPVMEEVRKIRVYDKVDKIDSKRSDLKYSKNFSPESLETTNKNIYKVMYKYIKENAPEFADAEDI